MTRFQRAMLAGAVFALAKLIAPELEPSVDNTIIAIVFSLGLILFVFAGDK